MKRMKRMKKIERETGLRFSFHNLVIAIDLTLYNTVSVLAVVHLSGMEDSN